MSLTRLRTARLFCLTCACLWSPAVASTFSSDFASGLPSGTTAYGNAQATGGAMRIVSASNNQFGSFVVPDLTGGGGVAVFDVSCDVFTGNATFTGIPADGWSFAWGNLPAAAWGEEGPTAFSGLVVSFDYFINGGDGETAREVTVSWNGVRIGRVEYDSYSNGLSVPVHIRLRHGGLLDVWHHGTQLFDGLALPGFTSLTAPQWGFGSRTGARNAEVRIDNLVISPDPILVTTTAATGAGSLTQAIADALAAAGPNQIHFSTSLDGNDITLDGSPLSIGAQKLVIDASMLSQVQGINANFDSRIFDLSDPAADVFLNRLFPRKGRALSGSDSGGAILCMGKLQAQDCAFDDCEAIGGGTLSVAGSGSVNLNRCTFRFGSANTGGAILLAGTGSNRISRCTFHSNFATAGAGGAIAISSGSLTLHHASLNANQATSSGGGLSASGSAIVTLTNCIIAGNEAAALPDVAVNGATFSTYGTNLIGVNDPAGPSSLQTGNPNASGQLVGSLQDPLSPGFSGFGIRGGYTHTLQLDRSSLARDKASLTESVTDQRGLPYFGLPDIGATEAQIGPIADIKTHEDTASSFVDFTVGSVNALSATSETPTLIATSGISIGGTGSTRTLVVTPEANANGSTFATIKDSVTGEMVEFEIHVVAVNDPPSFNKGSDIPLYAGNTLANAYGPWATSISAGPPDESGQSLSFILTPDNPAIFATTPTISTDTGLLRIKPSGVLGESTVTVILKDSGGGTDTSEVRSFKVSVTAGFSSDFSSSILDSRFHGSASLTNGTGRLIDDQQNRSGSFIVSILVPLRNVSVFDVSFNATMGAASGADPSDGYSFAVGSLSSASFGEEGPSGFNGLVVSFDTRQDDGEASREVSVKWKGNIIAAIAYDAYRQQSTPVHIRLRKGGKLDIWHDGNRLFSGLQLTGFTSLSNARWGFGASSRDTTASIAIDDLSINAEPFSVTTAADSGSGSLRQAILDTQSVYARGPNQIQFASGLDHETITLGSELATGSHSLLIDASSLSHGITLDAPVSSPAFHVQTSGELMLDRVTLTRASRSSTNPSVIQSVGRLELRDTTIRNCFSENVGGAVLAYGGSLHSDRCTFFNNEADAGGALWIQGTTAVNLSRCTLSGNIANNDVGGAISILQGTLKLSHCTITGNQAPVAGGGIFMQLPASAVMSHSILAGNSCPGGPDLYDFNGALTAQGVNLVGIGGSSDNPGFPAGLPNAEGSFVGTSTTPLDPLLSPLDNHGGFTETHPLRKGSPAVNAAVASTDASDQRGIAITGLADLGAYETGSPTTFAIWSAEQSVTALDPDADADQDAHNNLLEYAFGTDPFEGNGSSLGVSSSGEIRFPYQPSATDLRYTVQQSTDLQNWSSISEVRLTSSGPLAQGSATTVIQSATREILVTIPSDTHSSRFWRVAVDRE